MNALFIEDNMQGFTYSGEESGVRLTSSDAEGAKKRKGRHEKFFSFGERC